MLRRLVNAIRTILSQEPKAPTYYLLTPGHGKLLSAALEAGPNKRLTGDPDSRP